MPAPIEFEGYRIEKIEYQRKNHDSLKELEDGFFEPQVELGFDETFTKGLVKLSVTLSETKDRTLFLELDGFFTVDNNISTEDAKDFLALNGTAILLPYARSIISMLTSLDSPKAMVMPTVNVHDLFSSK